MHRIAFAAAALAAVLVATPAEAQYLWGVSPGQNGGVLLRIDPATAHATRIGTHIFPFGIQQAGAGFSCDGTYWAFSHLADFSQAIVYTVDLGTGAGSVQHQWDVSDHEGGVGLEWAYKDQALIWRASEELNTIDPKTGAIGTIFYKAPDGTLSPYFPSSGVSIARLQGTNALWSAALDENDDPLYRTFFWRIDVDLSKMTATQTRLGVTDDGISSIAASADGTFYAQSNGYLLRLDSSTGNPTTIGPIVDDDGNWFGPPGMAFGPAGVSGCDRPPTCGTATASVSTLWPPNHDWKSVGIGGITDPDGDPFTVTVTGIRQDEPTLSPGSGNFAPDGRFSGASAQVRAEREGSGDGRVYHVQFTADDGKPGGSCTGEVTVCVPHDQSGRGCVDGGALYDSTR